MRDSAVKEKKNGFRRIFSFVIPGLLCLSGCAWSKAPQPPVQWVPVEECEALSAEKDNENAAALIQERFGGMMVQITTKELLGSGVIYRADEEQLFILTAAHVLDGWRGQASVVFWDGLTVECGEAYLSEEEDVAFLRIPYAGMIQGAGRDDREISEEINEHLSRYCKAAVDKTVFDRMQKGDTVIAMGSAGGVAENAYEGRLRESWVFVESLSRYRMVAEVSVRPGMSGGGLFDRQGYFLGLLSAGSCEDGIDEAAVVPLSIIKTQESLLLEFEKSD
ncbi:MAG: serine protease [Roseburia sp.]|nr:serine protease [Roseburia sp.]